MSTTTSENAARLRGVANGLRAAANALVGASEDQTADALRGVAARLSEASEAVSLVAEALTPEPEPEPVWPTAPHVWWEGEVWVRGDDGEYQTPGGYRHEGNLVCPSPEVRDRARSFAREAVPVAIVPAAEWGILRRCVEDEGAVWDAAEALVDATQTLNGETNA